MIAALSVTFPLATFRSSLPKPDELACRSTLSAPEVDPIVAFTSMLLAARSVSVASVPIVLLTAALTVMFPSSVPTLPVRIVTFVPASSAALIVFTSTIAGLAELSGSKTPPPKVPPTVSSPAVGSSMFTFTGSMSHRPPLPPPAPAWACTLAPRMSRLILPEVSMNPPSPPARPPEADAAP